MKIIISPAKKMNEELDSLEPIDIPVFIHKSEEILNNLRKKSYDELISIWKCNEKIGRLNYERILNMDLNSRLTPAILSYEGIAFKYMAPSVFEYSHFKYVESNLRILSGFYGVLKPMNGVTPYRLEMQANISINGHKNLYDFWGSHIYDEVIDDSRIIINLASKEYSKCVEKYLFNDDRFITCSFVEDAKGKLTTKGTYAKMARGEMVKYMAETNVKEPEDIKDFNRLGYEFRDDLSNDYEYIFERVNI